MGRRIRRLLRSSKPHHEIRTWGAADASCHGVIAAVAVLLAAIALSVFVVRVAMRAREAAVADAGPDRRRTRSLGASCTRTSKSSGPLLELARHWSNKPDARGRHQKLVTTVLGEVHNDPGFTELNLGFTAQPFEGRSAAGGEDECQEAPRAQARSYVGDGERAVDKVVPARIIHELGNVR